MDIDAMRSKIMEVYPYPRWERKVANMEDRQVVAIYKNMQKLNALKPKKKTKMKEKLHQISIWEWVKENDRGTDSHTQCEGILE